MKSSTQRVVGVFAAHQFLGAWGVAITATLLADLTFLSLGPFGPSLRTSYFHSALTDSPYFPIQILLGLYLGWLLGHRYGHRVMVWVWVLPLLVLVIAMIFIPTLTPELTSVVVQAGVGESRFWHYLGRGCLPSEHCFDQLLVTMPFYASCAYSIGGFIALRREP